MGHYQKLIRSFQGQDSRLREDLIHMPHQESSSLDLVNDPFKTTLILSLRSIMRLYRLAKIYKLPSPFPVDANRELEEMFVHASHHTYRMLISQLSIPGEWLSTINLTVLIDFFEGIWHRSHSHQWDLESAF